MNHNGKISEGFESSEYLQLRISIKNSLQCNTLGISRIVAATFHGRNNNLVVNHKDGNTRNNKSNNL